MYSSILSKIHTKEDAQRIIQEIEIMLQSFYQEKESESVIKANVRAWVSETINEEWKGVGEKQNYLNKLKKNLEELKTLSLTLAFEPTQLGLEKISQYVKQVIGADCILDVSYDPKILGGAIIAYQGKYVDLSLKKVFARELEASREEILELIK